MQRIFSKHPFIFSQLPCSYLIQIMEGRLGRTYPIGAISEHKTKEMDNENNFTQQRTHLPLLRGED